MSDQHFNFEKDDFPVFEVSLNNNKIKHDFPVFEVSLNDEIQEATFTKELGYLVGKGTLTDGEISSSNTLFSATEGISFKTLKDSKKDFDIYYDPLENIQNHLTPHVFIILIAGEGYGKGEGEAFNFKEVVKQCQKLFNEHHQVTPPPFTPNTLAPFNPDIPPATNNTNTLPNSDKSSSNTDALNATAIILLAVVFAGVARKLIKNSPNNTQNNTTDIEMSSILQHPEEERESKANYSRLYENGTATTWLASAKDTASQAIACADYVGHSVANELRAGLNKAKKNFQVKQEELRILNCERRNGNSIV